MLKLNNNEITSVFELLGYKEDNITYSLGWILSYCNEVLEAFVSNIFPELTFKRNDVRVLLQNFEKEHGYTDIEITDDKSFHIIIEAKRGWVLPSSNQLEKYAKRESFGKSNIIFKKIVTMSECSVEFANNYQEFGSLSKDDVMHIAWLKVLEICINSKSESNNKSKLFISQFVEYMKGVVTMQNINSNEVYVVSLGHSEFEDTGYTFIEIVEKLNQYFHPQGGNGWPKEPPNYIAFRYHGKLQSIHHIEQYHVVNNLKKVMPNMPDMELDVPHFIYELGQAIKPNHEVKTGKIFSSGRVKCHLDLLLTSNTISEARDKTKERY